MIDPAKIERAQALVTELRQLTRDDTQRRSEIVAELVTFLIANTADRPKPGERTSTDAGPVSA